MQPLKLLLRLLAARQSIQATLHLCLLALHTLILACQLFILAHLVDHEDTRDKRGSNGPPNRSECDEEITIEAQNGIG
ncbi:MAG: hypothetical protein NVSMB44_29560 [Ktedonobacteraceae bacterium]